MFKHFFQSNLFFTSAITGTTLLINTPCFALASSNDSIASNYAYILGMAGFAINIILSLTILYCVVGFINASVLFSKSGDDPSLKDIAIHKIKICFLVIVAAVNFYLIYGIIVSSAVA